MTTTASGIKYSCAKCSDMGWIGYEKDGYFFGRECEVCGKVKKAEESAILNFAEIPDKYKGSVYANFDLKLYGDDKEKAAKCLNMCRGYTQNYSQLENAKGLYMFGNVKGTGKTRLMCAVANDLMRKGVRVKFTTSGRMLDEIKKTYDNSGVSSWQIMNEFCTCEYLIIDDFGTENANNWRNETFFSIINERYITKRVTSFTSNLGINELRNVGYDDRILSRIEEMCYVVPFPSTVSVRNLLGTQNMIDWKGMS